MYYVDIPKLLGKMAEVGYNKASFSRDLGINRNTLRNYLSDADRIPYEIIAKMAYLLYCTPEEAQAIFFAKKLA